MYMLEHIPTHPQPNKKEEEDNQTTPLHHPR